MLLACYCCKAIFPFYRTSGSSFFQATTQLRSPLKVFSKKEGGAVMRSVLRLLASGLVLSFLFVAPLYSQGLQTGGITGVVTDQGGALVKGATVDVISETTGRSVRTVTVDDSGDYTATLLPPGTYRLEVTSSNFKKAVVAGVQVRITETTRQDVSLEVGRIQET